MTEGLHIENVHAAYGKKEILRGITLRVSPGEVVALIGPNGSGKSTALRVAAGFLAPTEGRVWVGDQDITRVAAHERVGLGIAYSMQSGRVFPSLSVQEHLELSAAANDARALGGDRADVLDLFPNLAPLLGRRAGLLSGGERQALTLAMALLRRPHILLLDEPSAGLSPGLVSEILEMIRQLSRSWGTGVLLVEQDVEDALQIADRAIALVAGQVTHETNQPRAWLAPDEMENPLFWTLAGQSTTGSHTLTTHRDQ